jgi:radical SAM protein with 4Fe4S-binding SPASM domain
LPESVKDDHHNSKFMTQYRVPKLTMILLTYKCHHHCSFCSVLSPKDIDMPYERCVNLLSHIAEHGGKLIGFSGGEPFLYPYFYDVVMDAHHYNLKVSVTTAGDLINRSNVGWIGAFVNYLGLSLQGNAESHNRITKTDSYHIIIKNLKLLASFAPRTRVSILYTATAEYPNISAVNHLVELAYQYGYSVSVARAIKTGRCNEHHMLSQKQLLKLILHISMLRKYGLTVRMIDSIPHCIIPDDCKDDVRGCGAGIGFGCVEPSGAVKICPQSKEALGVINSKNSLSDIWSGPKAENFRKFAWIDDKCKNCDKLARCKSGCHVENENGGFQSDYYIRKIDN